MKSVPVGYDWIDVKARPCFTCGKDFEISQHRMIFCGKVCRASYIRSRNRECFYCGELATHRDHPLPCAVRYSSGRSFANEHVKTCANCNLLLHSKVYPDIPERISYLIGAIERFHGLRSSAAEWGEDEFQGLDATMAQVVAGKVASRKIAYERVEFAKKRLEGLSGSLKYVRVYLDDL